MHMIVLYRLNRSAQQLHMNLKQEYLDTRVHEEIQNCIDK